MVEIPSYACSECKREFQFEDIKYANDGKRILCNECYTTYAKRESKRLQEKRETVSGKGAETPLSQIIKLICIDCRYKFTLKDPARVNVRCPYCSRKNLMKDEITVENLIREVSHPDYGSRLWQ